jgi:predicted Zn-dependent peptidase
MKNIQSKKLKNGMQLILVPQEGAQSMTLLALAKVGSRYETPYINGAAHFVEHLMFKGTAKRPSTLDISKELDRYGAEYNAYTGKDITGYYIKMDAEHTNLAIDMLHDMLFHSKFDAEEIERERTVILEEINMYEDSPRDHIADLLEESLFHGSSLGMNIAGTRKTVREMQKKDLQQFHENYYIPERMTLVLAGKIVPGAVKQFEKTFGSVAKSKKRRDDLFTCFKTPKKLLQPVAFQKKDTEQVQLAFGFYGYPYGHKDRHAAGLLSLILGGNMSSRLFTQIRERRGLCYSIRAMHESLEDTGVLTIWAGLDKTRLGEAVKAIYEELNKVIQENVSTDELQRAKDYVRGSLSLAFEDTASQAKWYGWGWTYEHNLDSPKDRLKNIDAVTPTDIKRVARLMLNPAKMIGAAIGPIDSKGKFVKIIDWK